VESYHSDLPFKVPAFWQRNQGVGSHVQGCCISSVFAGGVCVNSIGELLLVAFECSPMFPWQSLWQALLVDYSMTWRKVAETVQCN
jgi:hypothetical protein